MHEPQASCKLQNAAQFVLYRYLFMLAKRRPYLVANCKIEALVDTQVEAA